MTVQNETGGYRATGSARWAFTLLPFRHSRQASKGPPK